MVLLLIMEGRKNGVMMSFLVYSVVVGAIGDADADVRGGFGEEVVCGMTFMQKVRHGEFKQDPHYNSIGCGQVCS
jgi:hypothetical protein